MDRVRSETRSHLRVTAAAVVSFGGIMPLAAYTVSRAVVLPSFMVLAEVTLVSAAFGGSVVYGQIPIGHWLQGARSPLRGVWGRAATIGVETVMGAFFLGMIGLVYGWSAQESAIAGVAVFFRAYPLGLISKLMGDRIGLASDVRIAAAWMMNANAGVTEELARSGGISHAASFFEMAAFNLAVGAAIGVGSLLRNSRGADRIG